MSTPVLTLRGLSVHLAPPRAPIAWARGLAELALWPARLKGGDMNAVAKVISKALRRKVVGGGVLWLTVPRQHYHVVKVEMVDVGGDHDAVLATLVHRPTSTVFTVLVINCMSVSTGKLHARSIMRAGMALKPTIIMASECRDFEAITLPGSAQYAWHQPGAYGSSESGTLVAGRRSEVKVSERRVRVASRSTSEGDGIDTRSMARARFTWLAA